MHQPKDLKVFFTYIDTAFQAELFKVTPANFQPMSDMLYLFVKEGFLTPDKTNKFYFTYLLALKNEIMKTSAESRINSDNQIYLTWSLMVMETPGAKMCPLLPKLLEQLYSFNRPEKPLSRDEFIQLY